MLTLRLTAAKWSVYLTDIRNGGLGPNIANLAQLHAYLRAHTFALPAANAVTAADYFAYPNFAIAVVNDLSHVWELGMLLPCEDDPPVATIQVGMWWNRHLVSIALPPIEPEPA